MTLLMGTKLLFIRNSATQLFRSRQICTTNVRCLKEIVQKTSEDGQTITIEGTYVDSPREKNIVNFERLHKSGFTSHQCDTGSKCPLCRLGLPIKHTDVLILQQFLDPSGNILQKEVTGLCRPQQKRMDYLVQMAKLAGLLKTPLDPEPTERRGYMKYNKYYDESIIDDWLAGSNRRKH